MKARFGMAAYFIALAVAAVIWFMRFPAILTYQAFQAGQSTVTGRIDDVQSSNRMRVVRYSYEVDGKRYNGELTTKKMFLEGIPKQVTYATSNPALSSIEPEALEGVYRVSLILCVLSALPLLIMLIMEVAHRMRKPAPAAS